ncbi:MAG: hypothetical protein ACRDUW_06535 [Pseudonocardiaceae bacterium]
MSEDSWKEEAREVRGIPRKHLFDVTKEAKTLKTRWANWHPTMEDLYKILIVTTLIGSFGGLIVQVMKARKETN